MPLLGLALVLPALAGEFVLEVGPQVELMSAGTWARVLPVEDGWMIGHGANGDFYVAPLVKTGDGLGDWEMDRTGRVQLTQHGELKDHAIRRCPDGSFLHVASANVDQPNDSAYAWRYGADWSVLASAPVEESEPMRAHNDMALLCSSLATGVGFGGGQGGAESVFLELDEDLNMTVGASLPPEGRVTGGALLADAEAERIHLFATDFQGDLFHFTFDADWNLLDSASTPVTEPPLRAYWPQGVLRAGDHWLVAHMVRDDSQGGGDEGNVQLVVLNDDWQIEEVVALTDDPPGEDGMRPWIARKGETLLMSYDRQREHTVVEVKLDLAALGVDPDEDTGWDGTGDGDDGGADSGADEDTDDTDDDDKGCGGCAGAGPAPGPALGLLGLVGALGLVRRRR